MKYCTTLLADKNREASKAVTSISYHLKEAYIPGGGGGYSDLGPTGVCRWSRQTRTYL